MGSLRNITESPMGDVIRRTSTSLPADILQKGQRIARQRRRSFSNYLADLIASDVEEKVDVVNVLSVKKV